MKPRIAVPHWLAPDQRCTDYYYDAVSAAGADCAIVEDDDLPADSDGLLLLGGVDLDPDVYGQAPHPNLQKVNRPRDDHELVLLRQALDRDIPVLCICRGHQLLNVAMGGTLEQDLDGPMARVVAVSGSALPAGLATAFLDRYGDRLYNLYGSTEVSWVSIAGPGDLRAAPGTAGRAPLGTRLAILDEHGEEVPTGVEGRVFVGNDMPFEGYTREGADVERHGDLLGTGDVGRVDEHGRLHLTGRADDMIVSGGENVHPGPVEDLIVARAEVREAAVTGVDDDEYGQRLAAYVVLEPGAAADADTVRGWVRAELSRFAVPRDVVFLDELPRNATGKVAHRELSG